MSNEFKDWVFNLVQDTKKCFSCGTKVDTTDMHKGKTIKCDKCNWTFTY